MQLSRAPAAVAVAVTVAMAAGLATARADGELVVRNAYYKERSTRVIQPMLDARFDAGPDVDVQVHLLVDSITSASVAAGAGDEPFNEKRYETGVAVLRSAGDLRSGGFARVSYEPDYLSAFAGFRGESDYAQKNTTLGVTLGFGVDSISNAGALGGLGPAAGEAIEGTLTSALGAVSLTQIVSPALVAAVTYDVSYLNGFQENPYRQVIAAGALEPERVPDDRLRHAVAGTLRGFVPATDTTLAVGYRLYRDDWGITAHTPEVRAVQELRRGMDLHLRYRYHRQGAAEFFKPIYDSADPAVEPFITDDVKLSAFSTHTVGVKLESTLSNLGLGRGLGLGELVGGWRADVVLEYVVQNNRYGDAVVAQLALAVPFEY